MAPPTLDRCAVFVAEMIDKFKLTKYAPVVTVLARSAWANGYPCSIGADPERPGISGIEYDPNRGIRIDPTVSPLDALFDLMHEVGHSETPPPAVLGSKTSEVEAWNDGWTLVKNAHPWTTEEEQLMRARRKRCLRTYGYVEP